MAERWQRKACGPDRLRGKQESPRLRVAEGFGLIIHLL